MELKLAIVESCIELGCCVRLVGEAEDIEAVYSQPMIDYGIRGRPLDLVAVNCEAQPTQIVFRWERVTVTRVDGDAVFVDDGIVTGRSARMDEGIEELPQVGDAVYVAGETLIDFVCNGQYPAHMERFVAHHFPAIEEMYRQVGDSTQESTGVRDPKKVVAEGYDQVVETYREWSQAVRVAERAGYTQLILDTVPRGADVLELGCATASITTPQLGERFELTGVDISPRQIEVARQQMPLATFVCGDMTQVDFPPESYDAVVAFYAIIHVPREEQPALLSNIAMWLRPNGLFVAAFTATATESGYEEDWLGAPMFWSGYDSATNIRMIEEAGLEIVTAHEEAEDEFGQPITFLWVVARKRKGEESKQ